ncbi:hypothetical protein OAP85_02545 [Candidatus Pelagibacter sp.]|nr:hypothetical protein [Candidatus Pelagibacter sp.]
MSFFNLRKNDFLFIGICFSLFVFSFDYKLTEFFRILDVLWILLFGLFLISNPKINKEQLILFLLIFFFIFISSYIGIIKKNSIEISRFVFIYKYLFVFITPWMIVSVVKTEKQIRIVNRLLLISFILLSSWSYMYIYFKSQGLIGGNPRPSYPFGNYYINDAHVFSSYLGFFLGGYLIYLKKFFNHNIILSLLICANCFVGLIATGSRTGILLTIITFLVIGTLKLITILRFLFQTKPFLKKKKIIHFILFIILIIMAILTLPFVSELLNIQFAVTERALNFNLIGDESSIGRIRKLIVALNEAQYSGWLLGSGLSSEKVWYDGIFSILLAHGGLLLILSIFVLYIQLIKKAYLNSKNQKYFFNFLFLILLYLISNLLTEHVFVQRNSFPILVLISITYINTLNTKMRFKGI